MRQAVNFAINRQAILDTVYGGNGEYSGHVPPGYGPWPLTTAELRNKYQKYDLKKAQQLMKDAGYANGFEVTMTTFSTPLDFQQVAAVMKEQLKGIKVDLDIQAQEPGTFAANNGARHLRLGSHGARHARRRRRIPGRVQPERLDLHTWYPNYKNVKVWRAVGNGRITLDQAKRLPLYKLAQTELLNDLSRSPWSRSRSTRSSASACRTCTSPSATSTRASAPHGSAPERSGPPRPGGAPLAAPLPRIRLAGDAPWSASSSAVRARDPDAVRDLGRDLPARAPAARATSSR